MLLSVFFFFSQQREEKRKIGSRSRVVAVIKLAAWSLSLWHQFVGGIWKSVELQDREVLKCSKERLMGHSGGSSDDQNAERKEDSEGLQDP